MTDWKLRKLARQAASGDAAAEEALAQERIRSGKSTLLQEIVEAILRRGPVLDWNVSWEFPGALSLSSPQRELIVFATPTDDGQEFYPDRYLHGRFLGGDWSDDFVGSGWKVLFPPGAGVVGKALFWRSHMADRLRSWGLA